MQRTRLLVLSYMIEGLIPYRAQQADGLFRTAFLGGRPRGKKIV